jgi:hypothetical protein
MERLRFNASLVEIKMNSLEFTLDHPCGIRISRKLLESDVNALKGVAKKDMGTGYIWYSLPVSDVGSDNISTSLCFHRGMLDSVIFAVSDPSLGNSWADWSEAKERERAKRTERWLFALGYSVGTYEWGEIWAGFDAKGGSGGGGIRYKGDEFSHGLRFPS